MRFIGHGLLIALPVILTQLRGLAGLVVLAFHRRWPHGSGWPARACGFRAAVPPDMMPLCMGLFKQAIVSLPAVIFAELGQPELWQVARPVHAEGGWVETHLTVSVHLS